MRYFFHLLDEIHLIDAHGRELSDDADAIDEARAVAGSFRDIASHPGKAQVLVTDLKGRLVGTVACVQRTSEADVTA